MKHLLARWVAPDLLVQLDAAHHTAAYWQRRCQTLVQEWDAVLATQGKAIKHASERLPAAERAVGHLRHAIERRDRYHAAWRSAAKRARARRYQVADLHNQVDAAHRRYQMTTRQLTDRIHALERELAAVTLAQRTGPDAALKAQAAHDRTNAVRMADRVAELEQRLLEKAGETG